MNDLSPPGIAEAGLNEALEVLDARKQTWAETSVAERIALLQNIKSCLMPVARLWAETAANKKGVPGFSPLVGEEWLSGPYALMSYCNALLSTLQSVKQQQHLRHVPIRQLAHGQIAARVVPHSIWDRLLLSGVKVDVWMMPGISADGLAKHTASTYQAGCRRQGRVALVLGAGNISSIAPLDALHKLFVDNEVVLLKLNPVNDYLIDVLNSALAPLVTSGWLRIVQGDARVGALLCSHPLVHTLHITGSGAAFDAIVWGSGAEGLANKKAGTPKNRRPITAELGGVAPTIVVPGPWSAADLAFQAEHVATQKLHNAGFNCIASQVVILSEAWPLKAAFTAAVSRTIASSLSRPLYYPGTVDRLSRFAADGALAGAPSVSTTNECLITSFAAGTLPQIEHNEVFGPALGITELGGSDAESFLVQAVNYANTTLAGTLGANILIHPQTRRELGTKRFESIIAELRYGCIAVNAWTGLGFLSPQATWGAFPGHTPSDVQSGIGWVHNTMLFEAAQRTVVEAPFRPFPRSLLGGSFSLLPRPPWFVTNRRAKILGQLLTEFQYRPGWSQIPRIFWHALLG